MNERKLSSKDGGSACNSTMFVEVPRGWSRIMENGCILYISPNNSKLRSLDHVIEYLKTEGTCKCGLECPLYVHKVFNFDARVPSRILKKENSLPESSCKHCHVEFSKSLSEKVVRQVEESIHPTRILTKPPEETEKKRGPGRPRKYPESKGRNREGSGYLKHIAPSVSIAAKQVPSPQSTSVHRYHGLIVSVAASTTQRTNIFNKPTFAATSSSVGATTATTTSSNHGVQLAAQAPTTTKVTLPPISVLALPVTEYNLSPPAISVIPTSVLKQDPKESVSSTKHVTTLTGSRLVLSPEMVRSALMCHPTAKVLSISTNAVKSVVSSVITPGKTPSTADANKTSSAATVVGTVKKPAKPRSRAAVPKTSKVSVSKINISKTMSSLKPSTSVPNILTSSPALSATKPSSPAASVTTAASTKSTVTTARVLLTTLGQAGIPSAGTVFPNQVAVGSTSSIPTKTVFLYAVPLSTKGNSTTSSASVQPTSSTSKPVTVVGSNIAIMSSSAVTTCKTSVNVIGIPANCTAKTLSSSSASPTPNKDSNIFLPQQTVLGLGPVMSTTPKPSIKTEKKAESSILAEAIENAAKHSLGTLAASEIKQEPGSGTESSDAGQISPSTSNPQTSTSPVAKSLSSGQTTAIPGVASQAQVPIVTPQGLVLGMAQPGSKQVVAGQVEGGGYAFVNPQQLQLRVASNAMAALASGTQVGLNAPIGVVTSTPGLVNPYFLGFVAPISAGVTSAGTTTTSLPCGTTAATSLQPTTLSGVSSAAIAAAYENFVPIAPATASQRLPQALAYLSNVYNPFSHGVPARMNILQYPYQMMQSATPYSVNIGGSGKVNVVGAKGQKFPISAYVPNFPASSSTTSSPSMVIGKTSGKTCATVAMSTSSELTKLSSVMTTVTTSEVNASSERTSSASTDDSSSQHQTESREAFCGSSNNHSLCDDESEVKTSMNKMIVKRACGKSVIWNPALDCCDVVDNSELLDVSTGRAFDMSDSAEDVDNSSSVMHSAVFLASPNSSFQPVKGMNKVSENRTVFAVSEPVAFSPLVCSATTVTSSPMSDFVSLAAMNENIGDNYCERLRKVIGDPNETAEGDNESIGSDSLPSSRADSRCSDNSETSTASETAEYLQDELYSPPEKKVRLSDFPNEEYRHHKRYSEVDEVQPLRQRESRSNSLKRGMHGEDCLENFDADVRSSKRVSQVSISSSAGVLANGELTTTSSGTQATGSLLSSISLQTCALPTVRRHFVTGDIVWAQARGLPSWPGKIVDEKDVGKEKPSEGKRWVMWFGEHTLSQVEVDRLKTLTDGLRSLDDKGKKKKCRGKKTRVSLEQAISEALEEVEKARRQIQRRGK